MFIRGILPTAALVLLGPCLAAQAGGKVQSEAAVFDWKKTRVTFELDGTSIQETSAQVQVLTESGVKALAILKLP